MGTTAVNLQSRANLLVEQANAFEQAASNRRWEELAIYCREIVESMFATLGQLRDLDPNLVIPTIIMIEGHMEAIHRLYPLPDDEPGQEASTKKEKKSR